MIMISRDFKRVERIRWYDLKYGHGTIGNGRHGQCNVMGKALGGIIDEQFRNLGLRCNCTIDFSNPLLNVERVFQSQNTS